MKTIILHLLLILSINCFCQESISNFFIEDRGLTYKKVFDIPEKNASEIKTLLLSFLNQVPKVEKVSENGSDLTGIISRMEIDYRKYGGKWGSTSDYLNDDMYASFIVEIKDNKYRLIVKDFTDFTD